MPSRVFCPDIHQMFSQPLIYQNRTQRNAFLFFFLYLFIYFVCTKGGRRVCAKAHTEVRGQCTGVGPVLLLCVELGLSGSVATALPAELSLLPTFVKCSYLLQKYTNSELVRRIACDKLWGKEHAVFQVPEGVWHFRSSPDPVFREVYVILITEALLAELLATGDQHNIQSLLSPEATQQGQRLQLSIHRVVSMTARPHLASSRHQSPF